MMSSPYPTFSFVIPTFNRPIRLKVCLQSILDQTCQDFEIIVVNDGEKEDMDWVSRFDNRIKYFTQSHTGRSVARNNGLEKAVGTYVIFMDDDDHFLPHFLSTALSYYEKKENERTILKLGASWQKVVEGRLEKTEELAIFDNDFSQKNVFRNIFLKSLSCGQTIIPKKHLKDIRFDDQLDFSEDIKFFLTLAAKGFPFYEISTPSVVFLDHQNRSVYQKENLLKLSSSRAALRNFAEGLNDELNYLNSKDIAQRTYKDNSVLAKHAWNSSPIHYLKFALRYWIHKVKYYLA